MTTISRRAILAGLVLTPAMGRAGGGTLSAAEAWTRPSLPNRPSALYLVVSNTTSGDVRLTGASSPAFERIEMHLSAESEGVMTMQPVASVDVAAGGTARFQPGGLHLMAFGPVAPLEEGDAVPLTLEFENHGLVEASVTVMPMTHGTGHGHDSGHSGS